MPSRLLAALLMACAAAGLAGAASEPETVGKVATLPEQPGPHWFWLSDIILHRTALFDGASGQLLGTITSGSPGVGTSVTKRRPCTSTIESEVIGVRLNTARKRPSSDSALEALPG